MWLQWKQRAAQLKQDTLALYLASRDPRVPLAAKLISGAVLAYLLSPIDLIPDFIPVLGYLDDLLLVPLGIAFAIKLIPVDVWRDCQRKAQAALSTKPPRRTTAAVIIVLIWLAAAAWLGWAVWRFLQSALK